MAEVLLGDSDVGEQRGAEVAIKLLLAPLPLLS